MSPPHPYFTVPAAGPDMVRCSKLGSDWNACDLLSLDIKIELQQATAFFNRGLGHLELDPDLLLPAINHTIDAGVNKETYRLLMNLKYYYHGDVGQRGALIEFATRVLEVMGYDEYRTILRRNYDISFTSSGQWSLSTPDICLYHCGTSMILLVVRIDKPEIDVMAQVIADAIAAFEHNNSERVSAGLPSLDPMVIPCITMFGTRPCFYKVPVTQQLSEAVVHGERPKKPTIVTYCMPPLLPSDCSAGMENPEYRQTAFQYYDAFHEVAKKYWSQIVSGF